MASILYSWLWVTKSEERVAVMVVFVNEKSQAQAHLSVGRQSSWNYRATLCFWVIKQLTLYVVCTT